MSTDQKKPHHARVLLASGIGGVAIIMATDSEWVASDIAYVGSSPVDIGIDEPRLPGLWLWEGELTVTVYDNEPETNYEGRLSQVLPSEYPALLAMTNAYGAEEDGPIAEDLT